MPLVIVVVVVAKARVLCGLRQCGVRRRWLDRRLREDETAETFYGNPGVVLLRAPFVERTIRERYGVVVWWAGALSPLRNVPISGYITKKLMD